MSVNIWRRQRRQQQQQQRRQQQQQQQQNGDDDDGNNDDDDNNNDNEDNNNNDDDDDNDDKNNNNNWQFMCTTTHSFVIQVLRSIQTDSRGTQPSIQLTPGTLPRLKTAGVWSWHLSGTKVNNEGRCAFSRPICLRGLHLTALILLAYVGFASTAKLIVRKGRNIYRN